MKEKKINFHKYFEKKITIHKFSPVQKYPPNTWHLPPTTFGFSPKISSLPVDAPFFALFSVFCHSDSDTQGKEFERAFWQFSVLSVCCWAETDEEPTSNKLGLSTGSRHSRTHTDVQTELWIFGKDLRKLIRFSWRFSSSIFSASGRRGDLN